jgi:hypothetical protein
VLRRSGACRLGALLLCCWFCGARRCVVLRFVGLLTYCSAAAAVVQALCCSAVCWFVDILFCCCCGARQCVVLRFVGIRSFFVIIRIQVEVLCEVDVLCEVGGAV